MPVRAWALSPALTHARGPVRLFRQPVPDQGHAGPPYPRGVCFQGNIVVRGGVLKTVVGRCYLPKFLS